MLLPASWIALIRSALRKLVVLITKSLATARNSLIFICLSFAQRYNLCPTGSNNLGFALWPPWFCFLGGSLSQRPCHFVNILICIVLFCKDRKSIGTSRSDIQTRASPHFLAGCELPETSLWFYNITLERELTRPIYILSEIIIPNCRFYNESKPLRNRYFISLSSIVFFFPVFQNHQFR